ncbi:unnamed protein product, partial [Vitis vinifera]
MLSIKCCQSVSLFHQQLGQYKPMKMHFMVSLMGPPFPTLINTHMKNKHQVSVEEVSISENGEELSGVVYNARIRESCRVGDVDKAMKLLAQMEALGFSLSLGSYTTVIEALGSVGRTLEAEAIFREMVHLGLKLDLRVIGVYRDNGMWKKAMEIVREIREMGVSLDKRIYNSIIDTFGKCGELSEALEVFEKMQEEGVKPDIMTWNSLIQWHCKAGDVGKALDGAIYAILVDIYGQYGRFQGPEECISALKSEGIQPSASMFCVLANAYAQQGLCEQTVKVLQLMETEGIEPNLIMLNMLINAFGIAGRHLEALSVYHHIKDTGISPDVVTYSTLMKACIRARKFDKVPEIYEEMESAGCTPDRKAREMLQTALLVLQQRHCKYYFGCISMV